LLLSLNTLSLFVSLADTDEPVPGMHCVVVNGEQSRQLHTMLDTSVGLTLHESVTLAIKSSNLSHAGRLCLSHDPACAELQHLVKLPE